MLNIDRNRNTFIFDNLQGRSFESDSTGRAWLEELGAAAKDMETAPAVATCHLFGVPCTAVNVVVGLVLGNKAATATSSNIGAAAGKRSPSEAESFSIHRSRALPTMVRASAIYARRALAWLDRTKRRPGLVHLASGMAADGIVGIHVAMVEEAGPLARVRN